MNTLYLQLGALLIAVILAIGATWWVMDTRLNKVQADHKLELTQRELAVSRAQGELKDYKLDFAERLSSSKDNLNEGYKENIDTITRNVAALRGIRLQDPSRSSVSGTPGNSGSTGSGDGTDSRDGLLSQQASDFLYDISGDADKVVERLRVCSAWESEVRNAVEEYNNKVEALKSRQ